MVRRGGHGRGTNFAIVNPLGSVLLFIGGQIVGRRGPTIPQLFSRSVEVEPACGGVETGGIGWKVGCAVSRDGCVRWFGDTHNPTPRS